MSEAMTIHARIDPPSRWTRLLSSLGLRRRHEARVPAGLRVYAVGDVHGCVALLDEMHDRIADDAASFVDDKLIVYLGDYIDRGPDSRGVVERLLHRVPKGFSIRFLKGNHEAALLDFLENAETYRVWRAYGAPETLLSYGVRPPLFDALEQLESARKSLRSVMPQDHLAFYTALESKVVVGDYAFVHAGIRPGIPLASQCEADLLWIREEFLDCASPFEKIIVHGHTPVAMPQRFSNRIAVDTGAYATGVLTCAVLEGTGCRFIHAGHPDCAFVPTGDPAQSLNFA